MAAQPKLPVEDWTAALLAGAQAFVRDYDAANSDSFEQRLGESDVWPVPHDALSFSVIADTIRGAFSEVAIRRSALLRLRALLTLCNRPEFRNSLERSGSKSLKLAPKAVVERAADSALGEDGDFDWRSFGATSGGTT